MYNYCSRVLVIVFVYLENICVTQDHKGVGRNTLSLIIVSVKPLTPTVATCEQL